MKKLILLSSILIGLVQLSAQQEVIYVKQGANGNGSSWKRAFGNLQTALSEAQGGQAVWVAAGTYYPTQNNDRSETFQVRDNVRLYGGFRGSERTLEERDWYANLTILSGEIGVPGNADNSYTIVYTNKVGKNTIIDGFVITGAASNGASARGTLQRSGGGLFNDGTYGVSNPTVANCLFIDNYARDGAAIYNKATSGTCEPQISNCQFVSNKAHLEGGAIFNDGTSGKASPKIEDCYFLGNSSNYGAVVRNLAEGGIATPTIVNSVFEANTAQVREIIYNGASPSEQCQAILEACRFFDNTVTMGNDLNNSANGARQQGYRKAGEIRYLRY